ncbi:uncharacterized protein METZ01_LOCUS108897 [marine metagenome]|uniref:Sulfotransferase family protein n=1 Tax=marine metagenome TaxID=408172 RepID=A0A381WVR2_9ZZZZ
MKPILRNLYQFIRDAAHVLLHGNLDSSDYIILDDKKVIFASVAKSACTSIKTSITEEPPKSPTIHKHIREFSHKRIPRGKHSYFAFTYVRNPYERLASCYRSKFNLEDKSKFLYSHYLFGYMDNNDTFEEFVRKVSKIPDFMCDRHFKSQHSIIFSSGAKVDYVGKVEDLPSDFEEIRQRYGFSELKVLNKSQGKSSEMLLTDEIRELIYNRFKKDFETFGYEKE